MIMLMRRLLLSAGTLCIYGHMNVSAAGQMLVMEELVSERWDSSAFMFSSDCLLSSDDPHTHTPTSPNTRKVTFNNSLKLYWPKHKWMTWSCKNCSLFLFIFFCIFWQIVWLSWCFFTRDSFISCQKLSFLAFGLISYIFLHSSCIFLNKIVLSGAI